MSTICPRCSYNLRNDELIEIDGYTIDPRGAVAFGGVRVCLRPTWYIILGTLAAEAPRLVRHHVLVDRLDLDGLDVVGALRGFVWELRKRLYELGLPQPIETVRGIGYKWSINPERLKL